MKTLLFATLAVVAACSSDPANPDSAIKVADAMPDAWTCPLGLEACGEFCVSTMTDPDNCGGCGIQCSGGQTCQAGDCACEDIMVAADPTGMAFVQPVQGAYLGALLISNMGRADAILTFYDPAATPLDMDLPLQGFGGAATLAYGTDVSQGGPMGVDFASMYLATAGTMNYSTMCDTGVTGVATNVTFTAVNPQTFQPIPGGCSFDVPMLNLDVSGASCP